MRIVPLQIHYKEKLEGIHGEQDFCCRIISTIQNTKWQTYEKTNIDYRG